MATFRRNKHGEWVVLGSVSEVHVGKVRVTRKDGDVRSVVVASLGNPFNQNGEQVVYGYLAGSQAAREHAAAEAAAQIVSIPSYDSAQAEEASLF